MKKEGVPSHLIKSEPVSLTHSCQVRNGVRDRADGSFRVPKRGAIDPTEDKENLSMYCIYPKGEGVKMYEGEAGENLLLRQVRSREILGGGMGRYPLLNRA